MLWSTSLTVYDASSFPILHWVYLSIPFLHDFCNAWNPKTLNTIICNILVFKHTLISKNLYILTNINGYITHGPQQVFCFITTNSVPMKTRNLPDYIDYIRTGMLVCKICVSHKDLYTQDASHKVFDIKYFAW